LLFKSKWDSLSVLNIENEKYFLSKNRGAAPFRKRAKEQGTYSRNAPFPWTIADQAK
jgi:hypothetical protein